MMGYLLERSPGPTGHQHVFWVLAAFTFAGSFCGLCLLLDLREKEIKGIRYI
jgi:hypothetical protein